MAAPTATQDAEHRTVTVAGKVTPAEKSELVRVAADRGVSVSDLLRDGALLMGSLSPAEKAELERVAAARGLSAPAALREAARLFLAVHTYAPPPVDGARAAA